MRNIPVLLVVITLAGLLYASLSNVASAQTACVAEAKLEGVVKQLKSKPVFVGTGGDGSRYYIFTNEESGKWFAARVTKGLACLLVEGAGFSIAKPVEPGQPT